MDETANLMRILSADAALLLNESR